MSVSATAWAFAQQVHPVSTKFVLVMLAWCASKEWEAYLSASDIAKRTSLDQRSIFRSLAQLKKLGFIQPTGSFVGQLPIYRVNPCHSVTPDIVSPLTHCHGTPDINARVNGSSLSSSTPLPSEETTTMTPPLPPLGGNGSLLFPELPPAARKKCVANKKDAEPSEDFLTFWREYPRHKKMKDAWKAWQQMKPPVSLVLESLAEHKKTQDWRRGQQYIPYPATWIRGEQWDDEL